MDVTANIAEGFKNNLLVYHLNRSKKLEKVKEAKTDIEKLVETPVGIPVTSIQYDMDKIFTQLKKVMESIVKIIWRVV